MIKKSNRKREKLTENITYCIIDNTIYLFQEGDNILEKDLLFISKKLALIIEDNDISYINITARNIKDKKEIYQKFGFTLSYYDVNKLNVLYPNKKNKIDYKCYGIMTKSDFLNRINDSTVTNNNQQIGNRDIISNYGFISNLFLLFGGIILLCYFSIQGAIYLIK